MIGLALLIAAEVAGPVLPGAAAAPVDDVNTAPAGILFAGEAWTGRYVNLRAPVADLSSVGFANRAESLRGQGLWQLCDVPDFGGHCETYRGDQATLGVMARKVVSARKVGN